VSTEKKKKKERKVGGDSLCPFFSTSFIQHLSFEDGKQRKKKKRGRKRTGQRAVCSCSADLPAIG